MIKKYGLVGFSLKKLDGVVTTINKTINNISNILSHYFKMGYNFLVFSPLISYLDGN